MNSDAAGLPELIRFESDRCTGISPDDLSDALRTRLLECPDSRLFQIGSAWFCRLPESFGLIDLTACPTVWLSDPADSSRRTFVLFYDQIEKRIQFQSAPETLVYLNGRRIRQGNLQQGDWILVNGILLRLLDTDLLVPADCGRDSLRLLPARKQDTSAGLLISPPEEPEVVSIEEFVQPEERSAQSASAAGMMVIGSLASLAGGLIGTGVSYTSLIRGAVSAGLSAAALIGWHQWNRLRSRRNEEKKRIRQLNEYAAYLQDQMESVSESRCRAVSRFWEEAAAVSAFDRRLRWTNSQIRDGWQLPVGGKEAAGLILKIPQSSWKESRSPARKALEELSRFPCDIPVWICLHQGQQLVLKDWSQSQIQALYLLWCWMVYAPSRYFVWIGFRTPDSVHPASRIEEEILFFDSYTAFLSCKTRWPQQEWTVCSKEWIEESAEDETRLYVCSTEKESGLEQNAVLHCVEAVSSKSCIFHADGNWTDLQNAVFRQSSFFPVKRIKPEPQRPEALQRDNHLPGQTDLRAELGPGVFWDLRREGPHALIAGATGSGKSEGLCTMLFQLALKNPPSRLQLILIDFKGGAFSVPLQDLPHTAALLTNLNGTQISRLETALKQELDRRQVILAEALQKDPGRRTDLEDLTDPESGDVFSHLVICVDEFGQLKARCPAFLQSLQETARIGRSLGVHLILSTQKPAGLVDEQIWANSRSRLCFSVLDKADSREVLGHDGAVRLKNSGEFILQSTGQAEKRGRAFYLKSPADGASPLQEKKDGIWQDIECWSLQDEIRSRILQRKETRRWILIPDPVSEAQALAGLWIDRIQRLEPFVLEKGSMTFICGRQEHLDQIAGCLLHQWQESAAICTSRSTALDERLLCSVPSLWLLADTAEPCLAILQMEDTIPDSLVETLCLNPKITLVLAAEEISFHQERLLRKAGLRICAGLSSRDQLSFFSEGRLRQEEEWPACTLLYPDRIERAAVGQKNEDLPASGSRKSRTESVILHASASDLAGNCLSGLIGIESGTQRPRYLSEKGLCIVWADPSGERAARSLLERLIMEDPLRPVLNRAACGQLSCIDLRKEEDGQAVLKEALLCSKLLYAGEGFSSWQYLLQVQVPGIRTGNGLLIEEGKGVDLMTAGLKCDDSLL